MNEDNNLSMPFDLKKVKDVPRPITKDEYMRWSKNILHLADEYFQIYYYCFKNGMMPCKALFSLIGFSTELYLKSILMYEEFDFFNMKRPEDKHNLYHLYLRLSDVSKEKIKNLHPCTNEKKENFELALSEIGTTFTFMRYSFEKRGMSYNFVFSGELVTALMNYSSEIHGSKYKNRLI